MNMEVRKERWQMLAIWLVASTLAVLSCLLRYPNAHIGSESLPMDNDSFYHAARILDAVKDSDSFYEFDLKIHTPEGSLLTWPWGYDYVIAQTVRGGLPLGLSAEAQARSDSYWIFRCDCQVKFS